MPIWIWIEKKFLKLGELPFSPYLIHFIEAKKLLSYNITVIQEDKKAMYVHKISANIPQQFTTYTYII